VSIRQIVRKRSKHTDTTHKVEVKTEEFLSSLIGRTPSALVLVLDQVQDPHNLGACLRTADAAGVDAVVIPKDRSASLTETVVRVASGAAEHVPLVTVTNLSRTLRTLKEIGVWLTGAADDAEQDLYDIDFTTPTAIIMGAEGSGLRRLSREHCDHLIRIPMAGHVSCLNVSVATGVCLFEVVRQRRNI